MALTRDQQRLFKIDAEIIDLRYLYEREKMREIEIGKSTLLMSRVFRNRLDAAVRVRTKLAKAMKDNPTQRKTYEIELQRRLEARETAYDEMNRLSGQLRELTNTLTMLPNDAYTLSEFNRLAHEVPIQKRRIAACERSYNSWAGKTAPKATMPQLDNKLPKNYDVQEDITKLYGTMPMDQEIVDAINKNKTPEDILGSNPNWSKKIENNASSDLLAQFADSEQEDNVMQMSPEEIEDQRILELENELAKLKRPKVIVNTNVVAQSDEVVSTEVPKEE